VLLSFCFVVLSNGNSPESIRIFKSFREIFILTPLECTFLHKNSHSAGFAPFVKGIERVTAGSKISNPVVPF
jgi:hypothetical protein